MRSLPVWTGEEIQREAKAKFAIDMNEWKARKAAQLEAAEAARRRTACERVLERLVSELGAQRPARGRRGPHPAPSASRGGCAFDQSSASAFDVIGSRAFCLDWR